MLTILFFQTVLRQLHYANRKPAYYLNRAFKLTCSQLGGRFTSNEYLQTVGGDWQNDWQNWNDWLTQLKWLINLIEMID